jgi:hypothetical protein
LNARYASPGTLRSNRKNLFVPVRSFAGRNLALRRRRVQEIFFRRAFLLAQPRFGVIPVERFRIG